MKWTSKLVVEAVPGKPISSYVQSPVSAQIGDGGLRKRRQAVAPAIKHAPRGAAFRKMNWTWRLSFLQNCEIYIGGVRHCPGGHGDVDGVGLRWLTEEAIGRAAAAQPGHGRGAYRQGQ
jgi:hypothetical protein